MVQQDNEFSMEKWENSWNWVPCGPIDFLSHAVLGLVALAGHSFTMNPLFCEL